VYGRGSQVSFGPPVTPPIIRNLMIANGVVFIIQHLQPLGDAVNWYGAVRPALVWQGLYLWQPFTYMWMHAGFLHIALNMFALWMFGAPLALAWGEKRFLRYYLVCGVGAGVIIATLPYLAVLSGWGGSAEGLVIPTVGASGAVMGVLLGFSFTWPDRTIMLMFPPIPMKAIWLIPLLFLIEFTTGPQNISHAGHLGGVLVGWIYLAREGRTPGAPNLQTIKHKWRRYRMRQKLRAVKNDERRTRRNVNDDDDHRTYH